MQPFFGLSDVHTPTLFPAGVKSFFFQLEIKVFADLAELGLHLQSHHKMTDRSFQVKTVTTSHPILPCSASGVPRGPRRALWCHRLLPPCLSSPSRARALAVPTCRPRRHPSRLRRISPPWPLMEALQPSKEYYKVAMVGLYKSLSTKKVKPSLKRLPWTRSLCVAPLMELGCSSDGLPLVSARRHERKFRVPHLARGRNIF